MTPSLKSKRKLHCWSRKPKRKNKPITMFDSVPCDWSVLPLLHPTPTTPTAQFSLDNKPRRRKRNRKKWKRSDSSDSDSVELMAPLTTPTFDFHKVISSLSLKTPTTTPTPSLVKTSLKSSWFQLAWLRCREEYQISGVERTFCAYYSPSPLLFGFQVFNLPFVSLVQVFLE